ncbi:MAG: hypothetical protein R6W91_02025 [Thermoplasmata archaeon]
MEEKEQPAEKEKTTVRDVGKGLILLGAAILLATLVMYLMAVWEETHYGLFSGATHLAFDTAMGIIFICAGILLARKGEPKKSSAK